MTDARRIELQELILRVAMGDREAFDALYEATSARLHAVCLSLLRDRPEAEDALQGVFVDVWRGAARFNANELSPMTWLVTLARNHALDRLHARGARPPASIGSEVAPPSAQGSGSLLPGLDAARAGALRDVYLGGLSYADLARREGVPVAELRGWMRQGLLQFREQAPQ